MATFNLSSPKRPTHSGSSLGVYSQFSSQNASSLSFYSLPKPSLPFSSISLRRKIAARPRYATVVVSSVKKLSETESVVVPEENNLISGIFPSDSGVYAVYGNSGELQFVGISRNVAASILTHKKSVPDLCCSVKVGVVDEPDRTALTQAWKSWVEEQIAATGKVPPGNESGNTTWVKKPPKKKSDLRLTPGRNVQLTVPLEELIDRLVKENKVVAFIKGSRSAPLCGFSQRVVAILESQGVDYESLDVLDEEHNYGLRETLKKYSNWPTFPQIFVNGEFVGGCDILSSMYEKGELSVLFKQ
ncbi:bifunctional monothiol glutaredoxin-S16, chloroplastic [Olea europaea subsp. europaea]|uniref:Bifunctional monothiol glutaredoxin-S16, chloroplastic n=1 Tax=Olea europaea subsp. europaea TaxID=158383 RepID=A0A8S0QHJ0_OLEEU|nr:bifunctional monothiol glutaredoxin-S16, chloroplastic [Olea europaea subsp. europaea]